jgi:hypothetical protein
MRIQDNLRRAFLGTAGVSAVLLLTTLVLWPVSYYRRVAIGNGVFTVSESNLDASLGRLHVVRLTGQFAGPGGFFLVVRDITDHSGWTYLSWNGGAPAKPVFGGVEYNVNALGFGLEYTSISFG